MITIRFDGAAVGKIRLATSPLSEVAAWLHLGSTRADHALFGDPGSSARFALRDPDVVFAARSLLPNCDGYRPDLLYPKPPPGDQAETLDRQLQLLRETPPDAVETQLVTQYGRFERIPRDLRHAVEAGQFTERLANGLQRFWRTALADQYDALDDLITADLANRARAMAQGDVGQMLNTLHPRIGWRDSRLEVDLRYEATLDLADVDLVVAPSVLAFPDL